MLLSLPPDLLRLLILDYCDILALLSLTFTCRKIHSLAKEAVINYRVELVVSNGELDLPEKAAPYPRSYQFLLNKCIYPTNRSAMLSPEYHLALIKYNNVAEVGLLFDSLFTYRSVGFSNAKFMLEVIQALSFNEKEKEVTKWLDFFYTRKYFTLDRDTINYWLEQAVKADSLVIVQWLLHHYLVLVKELNNGLMMLAAARCNYSVYFYFYSLKHPLSQQSLFSDVTKDNCRSHFSERNKLFSSSVLQKKEEKDVFKIINTILKLGLWDVSVYIRALVECVEKQYFQIANKLMEIIHPLLPANLSLPLIIATKMTVLSAASVQYLLDSFSQNSIEIHQGIYKSNNWYIQISFWEFIPFRGFLETLNGMTEIPVYIIEEIYDLSWHDPEKMEYMLATWQYLANRPVTVKSLSVLKLCRNKGLGIESIQMNEEILHYLIEQGEDISHLIKSNNYLLLGILDKYRNKDKKVISALNVVEVGKHYLSLRARCKFEKIKEEEFEKSRIAAKYLRVIEAMVRYLVD